MKPGTTAPFVVAVIGSINVDNTVIMDRRPETAESVTVREYHKTTGGKGANSAIATFRSSHDKIVVNAETDEQSYVYVKPDGELRDIEVRMIGAVGRDQEGVRCLDNLSRNGIDISGVRILREDEPPTGTSFSLVEYGSGDTQLISHRGANDVHRPADFMKIEQLLNGGVRPDLIITTLSIPRDTVEQIIATAGKANIDLVLNGVPGTPLLMSAYRSITHFIVNKPAAAITTGRFLEEVDESLAEIAIEILMKGVKNVVITMNEGGFYYAAADGGARGHIPTPDGRVVDRTGFTDAFVGYYTANYLQQKCRKEWDIRSAVQRAAFAAAKIISEVGTQEANPWNNELEEIIQAAS